jgi:hypothetical protein
MGASDVSATFDEERASSGPERGRRRWIVAVAALVLLLLATGSAAFLLWERTGSGVVVSLTTGEPVAGAVVRSVAGTATTDAAGRFELRGLRLGRQPVTLAATGFPPLDTAVEVGVFGGDESRIQLPDARLTVRVEEIAVEPKASPSVRVTVGGMTASRTASGTYEAKGVRPGRTTVAVTGASHEPTKTTVTLRPGPNAVTVRSSLTPWETYSRYFLAYKTGRWAVAYSYLHPDIAKRESLATYTNDMKAWGTPVSIALLGVRKLDRWTSPYTRTAYPGVVEIRRTLVTNKQTMRYVTSLPQHWANVAGIWRRVDL